MQLFLLTNVPGLGAKHELVDVDDHRAIYEILPNRVALVATPMVRKRYQKEIQERYIAAS